MISICIKDHQSERIQATLLIMLKTSPYVFACFSFLVIQGEFRIQVSSIHISFIHYHVVNFVYVFCLFYQN